MYEYRNLTPAQREQLVEERWRRGSPPHSPPHLRSDNTMYLLTASCYEHAHHLGSPARRDQLLDMLFQELIRASIALHAWVILPNHYHLLADIPDLSVVGGILRAVHGPTSRQWNLEDGTAGRKVWYRYADRAMRSERHYFTTLNHIHYNPVKHGCSASPYDWVESSVHWYVEHFGREWLRELWVRYPVKDYGVGWDEMDEERIAPSGR
jgi:putative transposase